MVAAGVGVGVGVAVGFVAGVTVGVGVDAYWLLDRSIDGKLPKPDNILLKKSFL